MSELQHADTFPATSHCRELPYDGLPSPSKSEITGKLTEPSRDLEVHRTGSTEKFFILGCPRSGTTMLQQALNRHSQIVIPPETKFFFYFYRQSHRQQLRHLQRLNEDLCIDIPPPRRRIRTVEESRAFFEDMSQRYLTRLGPTGVTHFGEKTPEHTSRVHYIRELYPNAKIIFIVRDGRDVALSLSRVPWLNVDPLGGFMIWLYYYRFQRHIMTDTTIPLHLIKYEDVVTSPRDELAKTLQFLDSSFEENVSCGYGNTEGIPYREYRWKGQAFHPIASDRVGAWKHALSSNTLQYMELLGGNALCDLGYPTDASHENISFTRQTRVKCCVSAFRALWSVPMTVFAGEFLTLARRSCFLRSS